MNTKWEKEKKSEVYFKMKEEYIPQEHSATRAGVKHIQIERLQHTILLDKTEALQSHLL